MYLSREVKLVVGASVFNDKIEFQKKWFDLMPYCVVSFLFANMNVFQSLLKLS